jgi:nucleoside-diphosphate-sugar epimerase
VLGFGRRAVTYAQRVPYEIGDDPRRLPWGQVDALVHCAYDFRPKRWPEIHRVNVDGSIALLRAARESGVKRAVFISSLSSFPACRSLYGQAKLEIEAAALELGCAVVRPGLVPARGAVHRAGDLRRASAAAFPAQSAATPGGQTTSPTVLRADPVAAHVCGVENPGDPGLSRALSQRQPHRHRVSESGARV